MKRAHRNTHRLIWIILAPVLAVLFWLALEVRPGPIVNDSLPPALSEEG